MRIAVTGISGQIVQCMAERAPCNGVVLVPVGRPVLDLLRPETVRPAVAAADAQIVVNAAARVAVDQGESEPHVLDAINATGAGAVAETAAALGLPIVHISTDYVFSGTLGRPYVETEIPAPINHYGRSKLEGERLVASANPNHAILRTACVYSPRGNNFVRTMLALARTREAVDVVTDVVASPTCALELADAIFAICRRLLAEPDDQALRGLFHVAGQGWCSRAELAEAVFGFSARLGGPSARVNPVLSSHFPDSVRRPALSALDCSKLASLYGIALPDWRSSVAACVARIVREAEGLR